MATDELSALRDAAAELLLAWARCAAPHYGPSGSMDLDLQDWPDAEGPSYYNQFAHYAYLLLSEGVVPGASDDERVRFRDIALGNIRYILSIADTDFHTPHFSRGRDWGRHIGEWVNYYLLRSLQVMDRHGVGDADLRDQMSCHIRGAVTQLADRFQTRFKDAPIEFPGNHATWHGLLIHQAGKHFDVPSWIDFANDFFARYIIPTQRPNGVWPEGNGIVVNYSMVTAQAVSLYAEASSSPEARASMGRALGFFKFFSFPDGSSSVACDCRMRYHARPMVFLPPGFLRSPAGRRLWLERIRGYCQYLREVPLVDNGAQGLAFYAASAHALFDWAQTDDSGSETPPEDVPAGRIDKDDWTGFLSWQHTPELPNRFILDTQNYIELWHKESGYLLGTGNSKYMPRFSTIRRINGGRSYVPDHAKSTNQTPTEVVAVYSFGPDRIQVAVSLSDAACRIGFEVLTQKSDAVYEAGLMLALKPGEEVCLAGSSERIAPLKLIRHPFRSGGLSWRGRSFTLPEGTVLDYPLIPHNPYTQHGLPAEEAYVADRTKENEEKAKKYRDLTKVYAREWLDYARASGQEVKNALALCVSAAGNKSYCEGG